MERWLVLAGALPFIALGSLHLFYTLQDERRPRRIAPRDRALVDAMRASPLGLTDGTDMWRAWIGFNLSHSVGVVIVGALIAYFALWDFEAFRASPILTWGAPAVAAIYALLAWRYWFRIPLAGTLAGAGLLAAGAVLIAMGG